MKARTWMSRGALVTGRKCSGSKESSPRKARKPTAIPTAPPTKARRKFSTQSWRRICQREAPRASRVAISGVRRSTRTRVRLGLVGAGDQQNESRGQHQCYHLGTQTIGLTLLQRHGIVRDVGVGVFPQLVAVSTMGPRAVDLGIRLLPGCAITKTSDGSEVRSRARRPGSQSGV